MTDPFEIYHFYRQNSDKHSPTHHFQPEFHKVRERYFWSEREHKLYVDYLRSHEDLAINHTRRKRQTIFLQISKILGTRTSIQVKSHHQKMLKKWKSIKTIIESVSMTPLIKKEQDIIVSTSTIKAVKIEEPINFPESYHHRYQNIYYAPSSREEQTYMPNIPWFHYYAYPPMMSQEFMGLRNVPIQRQSNAEREMKEVKLEYEEVKE